MAAVRREDDAEIAADSRTMLGFWIYLMTDCVLFAGLFATYAVLHAATFGGPSGTQIFKLRPAFAETVTLLTSSFTCGLATLAVRANTLRRAEQWFAVTLALGVVFLALEFTDFHTLASQGNDWRRSGFLSAYFTLVGAHGAHLMAGLIWMAVLLIRLRSDGLTRGHVRRLTLLAIFWHFLDLIWVLIFTIVYLAGVTSA